VTPCPPGSTGFSLHRGRCMQAKACAPRSGFSLIEILVSIMIFAVISIAMLTVFSLASSIFRDTEAARTADDDAAVALVTLNDDLSRLVSPANGGFWYAETRMKNPATPNDASTDVTSAGSMVISFVISHHDPLHGSADGRGTQQVVAWWTDTNGGLWRGVAPRPDTGEAFTALATIYGAGEDLAALSNTVSRREIIRGCLYLGVDLSTPDRRRSNDLTDPTKGWNEVVDAAGVVISGGPNPQGTNLYCTETAGRTTSDSWPDAIRVTLITAGSGRKSNPDPARFATRGFLARDINDNDTTTVRIGGIKTLPAGRGAVLRLMDPNDPSKVEWLGYTAFRNGLLEGVTRGAMRTGTTPGSAGYAFPRNTPVAVGRIHRLVRTLPP
jgi:prepilin-type N-terminal cleavage/methylation domain-containing protein